MKLIEILASGIGKVWNFLASTVTIGLVGGMLFFGLMVFMPNEVLNAIEILKTLIP